MSPAKNDLMLRRLKGKNTIAFLFQKGKNLHSSNLMLKVFAEEEGAFFSVGVSVPKKKFKLACDRNRIKRQLRVALKHNEAHIPFAGCAMLLYKSKKKIPTSVLIQETASLFDELRINKS